MVYKLWCTGMWVECCLPYPKRFQDGKRLDSSRNVVETPPQEQETAATIRRPKKFIFTIISYLSFPRQPSSRISRHSSSTAQTFSPHCETETLENLRSAVAFTCADQTTGYFWLSGEQLRPSPQGCCHLGFFLVSVLLSQSLLILAGGIFSLCMWLVVGWFGFLGLIVVICSWVFASLGLFSFRPGCSTRICLLCFVAK